MQGGGFDLLMAGRFVFGLPRYLWNLTAFKGMTNNHDLPVKIRDVYPILTERDGASGDVRGHYFHQDLWAARKVFERRPASHLDVGSRIDGFVAHLLTFMPVTVVDIRPLETGIEGLSFIQADATSLSMIPEASVESLSSLHVVEHFGLGRYGDSLDPGAWRDAMRALARVLVPGGRLYLSVPIGRERVEFNAHRVFDPNRVLEVMSDLELVSFAAVDDVGDLQDPATPDNYSRARFACGLFEFSK